MKSSWQLEQEALDRLGYNGTNGSRDRERAVEVVVSMIKEIEEIKQRIGRNT